MNCKPGDLAIVKRAVEPRNVGMLVKVEAPYTGSAQYQPSWWCVPVGRPFFWHGAETSGRLGWRDCNLIPIRDQPGEDEMLRIAGKPVETVRQIIEEARQP